MGHGSDNVINGSSVNLNGGSAGACTAVSASTTVATAIAADPATRKWVISNDATALCYVGLGFVPTASLYTYLLAGKTSTAPGGSCEGVDKCDIKVLLSTGTGNVMATKVTI